MIVQGCIEVTGQNYSRYQLDALLDELVAVATLSMHFDPSLLVMCWRGIGKLACGHVNSEDVSEQWDSLIVRVVQQLCAAIIVTTQQSVTEEDYLLERRLKCGRYLNSLLLQLLSCYPVITALCCEVTFDLLLSTHQLVFTVSGEELRDRLESNLLILVRMVRQIE